MGFLMVKHQSRLFFFIVLILISVSAMAVLYVCTPVGAGLANDSAAYIAGARSILQGKGYSDIWLDSTLEPITHYPPLLSLTLAGLGIVGIDPLRGARILNIVLFGLNTFLMGILGWRISSFKMGGLFLAVIFFLSSAMLRVHVYALSEPLFIFLSLLCFLLLDLYIEQNWKLTWLILAGIVAGLVFLTRYSGLALLPTILIALFLNHKSWKDRFISSGIFLLAAIPFMAAWFLRNMLSAGNATNRIFNFHPITSEIIQPGLYNISQFLMPVEPWRQFLIKSGILEWILVLAGLTILAVLVALSWRMIFHPGSQNSRGLIFLSALYIFGYLAAILFSMSFFDASTKFQPRILAPLYPSFWLLMAAAAAWFWKKASGSQSRFAIRQIVLLLILGIGLVFSGFDFLPTVAELSSSGQGYASWKWHDSLLMAQLKKVSPGTAIYTNSPPAVYLVTGRASRVLPTPIDPVDNLARKDYAQNLAQMKSELDDGKAVLALFDTSSLGEDSSTQELANVTSGLKILLKAQNDVLYGKP